MSIPVCCPNCQRRLRAPDVQAGKIARCPACKSRLCVPAIATEPPPSVREVVWRGELQEEPDLLESTSTRRRLMLPIALVMGLLSSFVLAIFCCGISHLGQLAESSGSVDPTTAQSAQLAMMLGGALLLLAVLAERLLWIYCLIDVMLAEPDPSSKLVWLVLLLFLPLIGTVAYLFGRRPQRRAEQEQKASEA